MPKKYKMFIDFVFTIIFQLSYRMSNDNQCFKSFDIKVLLYLTYYLQ